MSSRGLRHRQPFYAVVVGVTVLSTLGSRDVSAQAADEEVFVTVGSAYVGYENFGGRLRGIAGSLSAFYGLNSTWSLGAMGRVGWVRPTDVAEPEDGTTGNSVPVSIFAGPAFNVDIVSVVPFVTFMPGVHWSDGALSDDPIDFGVRASMGFDYRWSRFWAVGVEIEWHAVTPNLLDYPVQSVAMIRLSRIFDTGLL